MKNLQQIEQALQVEISNRNNHFQLHGNEKDIITAKQVLLELSNEVSKGSIPEPQQINLLIKQYTNTQIILLVQKRYVKMQ